MSRTGLLKIDEHINLANTLKDTREAIIQVLMSVPLSSKQSRRASRAVDVIDKFRSAMDDQLCGQVPEALDPRKLTLRVYYGNSRFKRCTFTANEDNATDAFKGWYEVS